MMKLLSALFVAQTILILFLFGKLAGIDDQIRGIDAMARTPPSGTQDLFRASSDCVPNTSLALSEDQLREIIASELNMQMEALQPNHSQQYSSDVAPGLSPAENQRQLEKVAQQIEYHASVGQISSADMMVLQSEIGKLGPAGRKQMMRELVQRMNSGQLEGQL